MIELLGSRKAEKVFENMLLGARTLPPVVMLDGRLDGMNLVHKDGLRAKK